MTTTRAYDTDSIMLPVFAMPSVIKGTASKANRLGQTWQPEHI